MSKKLLLTVFACAVRVFSQTNPPEIAYHPYPILLVHGFNTTVFNTWGINNPKGDQKSSYRISTLINSIENDGDNLGRSKIGNALIYAFDPNTLTVPYPRARNSILDWPKVQRQKLSDQDTREYKNFACPPNNIACGSDRENDRFYPIEEFNSYNDNNHSFVEVYSPYFYNESDDGSGTIEKRFNISSRSSNPPTSNADYDISFGGQTQLVRIRIIQMLNEYYGDWKWVGDPAAKIKIVCHSNGGLIVSNALKEDEKYWQQGAGHSIATGENTYLIPSNIISGKGFRLRDHIDQVITMDTPYNGSDLAKPWGRRFLVDQAGVGASLILPALLGKGVLTTIYFAVAGLALTEAALYFVESGMGASIIESKQDPVYKDFKPGSAFIKNLAGLPPMYSNNTQIPYVNYVGISNHVAASVTLLAIPLWVGVAVNLWKAFPFNARYYAMAARWAVAASGFTQVAVWAYNSDLIVHRTSQDMNSIFPTSRRNRVRRMNSTHASIIDNTFGQFGKNDIFQYLNGDTKLTILGAVGINQSQSPELYESADNTIDAMINGSLVTDIRMPGHSQYRFPGFHAHHPFVNTPSANDVWPLKTNDEIRMLASMGKPKIIVGNLEEYYMNHDTLDISVNGGAWSLLNFNQDFGKYDTRWLAKFGNFRPDIADVSKGSLIFAPVNPSSFLLGENNVRLRVRSAFGQNKSASVAVVNGLPLPIREVNPNGTEKPNSLVKLAIRPLAVGAQRTYYFSIDADINGASSLNSFAMMGLNGETPFSKVSSAPGPGQFQLIPTGVANRYLIAFTFSSNQLGRDASSAIAFEQQLIFKVANTQNELMVKFAPFYIDPQPPTIQVNSPLLVGDFDADGYLTSNDHCQGPTSQPISPPLDCNAICSNSEITDPAECAEAKQTCLAQGPTLVPGQPECDGEDNDYDGWPDSWDLNEGNEVPYYSPIISGDNSTDSKPVEISFVVNDDLQAYASHAKSVSWNVRKVSGHAFSQNDPILYTKVLSDDNLAYGKNVVDFWYYAGIDVNSLDGMYCVVISAMDKAGSAQDQTLSPPSCFIIDTKPPSISVLSPFQDQNGSGLFNKSSVYFSMIYKPGAANQTGYLPYRFDSETEKLTVRFTPLGRLSWLMPIEYESNPTYFDNLTSDAKGMVTGTNPDGKMDPTQLFLNSREFTYDMGILELFLPDALYRVQYIAEDKAGNITTYSPGTNIQVALGDGPALPLGEIGIVSSVIPDINRGTNSLNIDVKTGSSTPNADAGGFSKVQTQADKNFELTLKLQPGDFPTTTSLIGLDVRQSPQATSPHIAILVGGDGKIRCVQRVEEGAAATTAFVSGTFSGATIWLKEKRVGGIIYTYYSLDGVNFLSLCQLNLGSGEMQIGIWTSGPTDQTIKFNIPYDAITFTDGTTTPEKCQDFQALLAEQTIWVGDRGRIQNGNIRAGTSAELGADSHLTGDFLSAGTGYLRERAKIVGNAQTVGVLSRQNGTSISGTISRVASLPACSPVVESVPSPGTQSITVLNDQVLHLNPGQYGDVLVQDRATLNLKPGIYQFKTFILLTDVKVNMDAISGPLTVKVRDNMAFGDRFRMTLASGSLPNQIRFYSHQTTGLRMGTDSRFIGLLQAPRAEITINSRANQQGEATFYGAVQGKNIRLEPDVLVESLSLP